MNRMGKIAKLAILVEIIVATVLMIAGGICMAENSCGLILFVTGKLLLVVPILAIVLLQTTKQLVSA